MPSRKENDKSMIILVTGGAGYVGSHASRMLAAAGHEVWVDDNLSLGHREAVAEGRLIEGDLHDGELIEQVLREKSIDAVTDSDFKNQSPPDSATTRRHALISRATDVYENTPLLMEKQRCRASLD